ncbi:AAA family ATPase [Cellulomonas sp. NPDC058312]|uniref:AAA family ATPase n=1 Tax=Cellulomonas sp. NPDC058312 TaxID=3346441 RepID=UPI0036E881CC
MAGRHLKELVTAYHARDDLAFRRAALAIIDEEEAKRHTTLARDLRKLLAAGARSFSIDAQPRLPEPPRDRDSNAPLADVTAGGDTVLRDLVFDPDLADRLEGLVDEVAYWPVLDTAGVPRRNRVLLYGPPGCGKTSIAGALANQLGWPLVTTRVDGLMSSYLGETASNLRSLFDFASAAPSVVLLDEFDSLGKVRDDPGDHGELRRVVNAVLQLIDKYQGPSILIAATNNPGVLDTALWRRFDEVVEIPLPRPEQIRSLLGRLLHLHSNDEMLDPVVKQLTGLSFAAVEHTAHTAKRRAIMTGRSTIDKHDLRGAAEETATRPWV